MIVLEDCHWIGPLAHDLLTALVRATAALPVLFVLAYRPAAAPGGGLGLEHLPQFAELPLGELEPTDAEQLVRSKLAQLFGAGADASAALLELVLARSQGNPFYVEELLNYVHGQGIDPQDEAALRDLELPESLHSLILSRVDTLSEAPRRTLKVASVVGRSFLAPALPIVYPELGTRGGRRRAPRHTARARPGRAGPGRRAVLHLQARRHPGGRVREHAVLDRGRCCTSASAATSRRRRRTSIGLQLDLLAHHYWLSENQEKKREYLVRAGEAAEASYANAAAIDYLERAAPLVGPGGASRPPAQARQGPGARR